MRRNDGRWAGIFLAPYLLFFIVFTLTPVLYGFWISLHDWHVLSKTVPFVGLTNYRVAFGDDLFRIAVARTCLFALMVVPAGNIASLGLAAMLNGVTRGSTLFKVAYYVPVVTSITATAIIWRLLYAGDGLLNHVLG
ncbi:sugar ABC transporter permease, partial [bacterium]